MFNRNYLLQQLNEKKVIVDFIRAAKKQKMGGKEKQKHVSWKFSLDEILVGLYYISVV